MFALKTRCNTIMMFSLWTMGIMGGLNFFSAYLLRNPSPKVSFTATNITYLRPRPEYEILQVKFDLSADLTSLYTWNLKQIYLAVEFEVTHPHNKNFTVRQVVHDSILSVPESRAWEDVSRVLNLTLRNTQT